jgi:phosphate transport system substrate-binding protein
MRKHSLQLLAVAALAMLPLACGPSNSVTIQGCGATFPAPLYQRWFLEFYQQNPDVKVNYQAIGSGAGMRQLEEGLVSFGATDEAQSEDKLKGMAKKLSEREGKTIELLQIPLTAGSVAICYNLPGNPQIQLTRSVYVSIFIGEITEWNDERIQSINPNVKLPAQRITVVRRAEGSGTTFNFTNHLNAIDSRWKKDNGGPGAAKTVQWPVGIGGKGNSGVAALIQQTPGAIGYIETGFAELTEPPLPVAILQNQHGHFVKPTDENARAALAEAKFNKVFGATIPDPKGADAYPIVTFTWVVCRKKYENPKVGEKIKALLNYCLESGTPGRGQELSTDIGYVALPDDTLKAARKAVQEIDKEAEIEPQHAQAK